MTWRTGMKVVCVDDSPRGGPPMPMPLSRGKIYTVRWVGRFEFGEHGTHTAIKLSGIYDTGYLRGKLVADYPFGASRFRPLVERKTDISIFTRLLNPENHRELEGV